MIDFKAIQFFDKPAVMKRVKEGSKSALSKAGAFIRTFARSSIRKRKRSAKAGEPPSSHIGTLKRLLFFAFDAITESVVVGPERFKPSEPTVPELLEEGGQVTVRRRVVMKSGGRPASEQQKEAYRRLLQAKRLQTPPATVVTKSVTYKKHPYMLPAYEHEQPKFPGLFTSVFSD